MPNQLMSDQNIPHLKDIFGFGNNNSNKSQVAEHGKQEENVVAVNYDSAILMMKSISNEGESMKTTSNHSNKKTNLRHRNNSRILTEKDVKQLEQHLSMKKTIRKKIMRDLQQALVEDPNEFRLDDDVPLEQLKAQINIQSFSFGVQLEKHGRSQRDTDNTFLGMLRNNARVDNHFSHDEDDDDCDSDHSKSKKRDQLLDTIVMRHCNTPSSRENNVKFWRRFTSVNNSDKR
ncbi:uncharacterized protein LOC130678659 isoform X2 [Microplitis mediator]|uniref:uncharacterized protein LOC130678659 isoform X2 n=1 Tax=Microplitis mediator TaxID=375433 RepID=UPI002556645C|nr:uncharacterized protein LOC130678659 isoform X2 [Microplitis mediator]